MEREFKVNWEGKPAKVKQRTLKIGESLDITEKHTVDGKIDKRKILDTKVQMSIIESEFPKERWEELDEADGVNLIKFMSTGGTLTKEEVGEIRIAPFRKGAAKVGKTT